MTDGPRTSEVAFNGVLAEVLRRKHPLWKNHLGVEQTGVFPENPALRPDILIEPPNAQPVVVETEYAPAHTVEEDARARLGRVPRNSADPVEQVIAIRVPAELRLGQAEIPDRIAAAVFDYCVFSGDPSTPERWPATGWLSGSIDDIVRCIEHSMVSQRLVDQSILVLEHGVRVATHVIQGAAETGFSDTGENLGRILNQNSGEQTNRMAMTIIANALTFHTTISGTYGIPSIDNLQADKSVTLRSGLLTTWRRILDEINYWPIFKVASELLIAIPVPMTSKVLKALIRAAEHLSELGITTRHDLSGRMFQNLIVDRKFLATYYTLPTSAALLAEAAVGRLSVDWSDLEGYPDLRIADLSCGTGTLLSAAYHAILSRYRQAGGNDSEAHRQMIEGSIVAADIMPAAAHLCASQLSSVHPTILFDNTRVYTMPYGVEQQAGEGIAIGSLELIPVQQTTSLFATGQKQAKGGGEEEVRDIRLPHHSVDLVIMNPPFTRPTNHESTEVPVPSFAGFQTSEDEQRAMSTRLRTIRKALSNPAGHGNAGLASNFIDLAHVKIKPGGTVALVLPIAVVQGEGWSNTRSLLLAQYHRITVITIATTGNTDRAFSADTGMAEAQILATKSIGEVPDDQLVLFVNLRRRPTTLLEASVISRLIEDLPTEPRKGHFYAGDQILGVYFRAPLSEGGHASLSVSGFGIADVMNGLSQGELGIPRYWPRHSIPIVSLGELGERGLLHRDIGTHNFELPPHRGPFMIVPISPTPSYPVLWRHNADLERCLVVRPDSEGQVRQGCDDHAADVWETATRLHFSLDFRINSQSLAACCTPNPVVGGRAWPNFRLRDEIWENVITLWANSTLGLMCFWWAGSLQQQGRSILTITALPGLKVLDPRPLSNAQLSRAEEIFSEFENRPFLPANEAYHDPVRIELDRAVLVDLLGYPEDILEPFGNLRLQWCNEPSVHGGKSTRPFETDD